MRDNIERQHGTVFSEAAAAVIAGAVGKSAAHALLARLAPQAASTRGGLQALLVDAVANDNALASVDATTLTDAFDIDAAARRAGAVATRQLDALDEHIKNSGDPT